MFVTASASDQAVQPMRMGLAWASTDSGVPASARVVVVPARKCRRFIRALSSVMEMLQKEG